MKKTFLLINISLLTLLFDCFAQTTYNVNIVAASFSYNPKMLSIQIGDKVAIQASATYPLQEVEESTWNANENTPKTDGVACTSTCTTTFNNAGVYYFVCASQVAAHYMKLTITVTNPLGIQTETFSSNGLKLFPNPAKGKLNIEFAQPTVIESVQILNMNGIVALEQHIEQSLSNYQADISNLKAGLYQVVINSGGKKLLQKLVVE